MGRGERVRGRRKIKNRISQGDREKEPTTKQTNKTNNHGQRRRLGAAQKRREQEGEERSREETAERGRDGEAGCSPGEPVQPSPVGGGVCRVACVIWAGESWLAPALHALNGVVSGRCWGRREDQATPQRSVRSSALTRPMFRCQSLGLDGSSSVVTRPNIDSRSRSGAGRRTRMLYDRWSDCALDRTTNCGHT